MNDFVENPSLRNLANWRLIWNHLVFYLKSMLMFAYSFKIFMAKMKLKTIIFSSILLALSSYANADGGLTAVAGADIAASLGAGSTGGWGASAAGFASALTAVGVGAASFCIASAIEGTDSCNAASPICNALKTIGIKDCKPSGGSFVRPQSLGGACESGTNFIALKKWMETNAPGDIKRVMRVTCTAYNVTGQAPTDTYWQAWSELSTNGGLNFGPKEWVQVGWDSPSLIPVPPNEVGGAIAINPAAAAALGAAAAAAAGGATQAGQNAAAAAASPPATRSCAPGYTLNVATGICTNNKPPCASGIYGNDPTPGSQCWICSVASFDPITNATQTAKFNVRGKSCKLLGENRPGDEATKLLYRPFWVDYVNARTSENVCWDPQGPGHAQALTDAINGLAKCS